jgi:hypothetical protein
VGLSIADQLQSGMASMIPSAMLAGFEELTPAGRPTFQAAVAGATVLPPCPLPSENPIIDTDGDKVPNSVTYTFALPQCAGLIEGTNTTLSVVGALRFQDPAPTTAGFAVTATLTDLTATISDGTNAFSINRDGTVQVSATTLGLSQSQNVTVILSATGQPTLTVHSNWSATFVPSAAIVSGEPLPSGVLTPSSTISTSRGGKDFTFTLTAPAPLQYSAACAASELSGSPFSAGELRATLTGPSGNGYLRIRWENCDQPQVIFVAAS